MLSGQGSLKDIFIKNKILLDSLDYFKINNG
jgi:hypothetical protein